MPTTRDSPPARSRARTEPSSIPYLERIFRTRTVAEWLKLLRAADVPAAPVNHFDKAFAEPPVAEREMIVEYDHPDVGKVRLPGNPIKMSGVTGTISKPAPRLGEHTDVVLSQVLALSAEEIDNIAAAGRDRLITRRKCYGGPVLGRVGD